MNDFQQERAEQLHQEAADRYTQTINVDGVLVYPVGYRQFGIEVHIARADIDVEDVLEYYESEDLDDMDQIVSELSGELDAIERLGLNRQEQQYFVIGFLDDVVRVTA